MSGKGKVGRIDSAGWRRYNRGRNPGEAGEQEKRKESAWGGYGVGAENEAVDTSLERDFSILYHPWTPVGVYEDIADVEVGACAFYFAFVVEVESLGVEVEGENMQWDGVVCQPIVFCIAGGELGSDCSGLGGCGLVMAGSANVCDGDEDSERAMSHREKGRYCSLFVCVLHCKSSVFI